MYLVINLTGGQGAVPDCCNAQKTAEAFGQDIMDRYGNTEYFDDEAAEYYEVESWWWRLVHWFRAFPRCKLKGWNTMTVKSKIVKILAKNEKAQSGGFTEQNCVKCGKTVEIDFLTLLLNLDGEILCTACRNK